jgi:ADP-ribose pyrophosphatase YjhB (NUDIX family)
MLKKNSHCSYCGHPFNEDAVWPRECSSCKRMTFQNPIPVSVLLLPVDNGLLLIRRNIEPKKGMLALPGGFINSGETWQQAGARELFEETGVKIEASDIELFNVQSAPDDTVLIFGLAKGLIADQLPAYIQNEETTEFVILKAPEELAFSIHTLVVNRYFNRG